MMNRVGIKHLALLNLYNVLILVVLIKNSLLDLILQDNIYIKYFKLITFMQALKCTWCDIVLRIHCHILNGD